LVSFAASAFVIAIGYRSLSSRRTQKKTDPPAGRIRQPEAANTVSRTLFVGLAMIETMAIYCLVIALLLLFVNPFA